jgi:hypothetical protein
LTKGSSALSSGDWRRVEKLGVKKPGSFRIDGLVSGTYSLYVQTGDAPSGGNYGTAEITVTDHNIEGLKIRLVPSVVISGTIRMLEDGESVPKDEGLVADLMPVDIFAGFSPLMPLKGDRFEGEVHPGQYWPEFSLPDGYAVTRILFGGVDVSDRPVSVSGPGELTFVVTSKPGAIAGVVRDRNQNPVKGATVRLTSPFGDPRRSPETQSGANGEFGFRNLRPGKYSIEGAGEIEVRLGETARVTVNQ